MLKASYTILKIEPGYVLISDNDIGRTVTNDAERVVSNLYNSGIINDNKILYYIDTEGRVDILKHKGEEFTGFESGFNSEEEFYSNIK